MVYKTTGGGVALVLHVKRDECIGAMIARSRWIKRPAHLRVYRDEWEWVVMRDGVEWYPCALIDWINPYKHLNRR